MGQFVLWILFNYHSSQHPEFRQSWNQIITIDFLLHLTTRLETSTKIVVVEANVMPPNKNKHQELKLGLKNRWSYIHPNHTTTLSSTTTIPIMIMIITPGIQSLILYFSNPKSPTLKTSSPLDPLFNHLR